MKKIRNVLLFDDSTIVSFLLNFVFSVCIAIGLAFGSLLNPSSVYGTERCSEIMADKLFSEGLECVSMGSNVSSKEDDRRIHKYLCLNNNYKYNAADYRLYLYTCFDWEDAEIDFQYVIGSYEKQHYCSSNTRNALISETWFQNLKKYGIDSEDGTHTDVDESNIIGLVIPNDIVGDLKITGVYRESSFEYFMVGQYSFLISAMGIYSDLTYRGSYLMNPSRDTLIDLLRQDEFMYSCKSSPGEYQSADLGLEMRCYPRGNFYYRLFFYLLFALGTIGFMLKEIYDVFLFYHSYKRKEIGIRKFFVSDIARKGIWSFIALTGFLVLYLCLFFKGDHLLVSFVPSLISSFFILLGIYIVFVLLVHALGCFISEGMKKD